MENHCGEGVPRRCFTLTRKDGVATTICLCYNQWVPVDLEAYPKHPRPDPPPYIYIEGVAPEIMREIKLLDMISFLSTHINKEVGKSIQTVVDAHIGAIQGKLPDGIVIV